MSTAAPPPPPESDDAARAIEVEGACTHNLRNVDCRIPHGRITVVTGVSGSGKSSLAFDTIYAEGQRRYVETLSTYARQFLQQMRKPPVRSLRNMPPSLALRQGNPVNNARSSVGTISELNDHLHLLLARAGHVVCKSCGADVVAWNPGEVSRWLHEHAHEERVLLLAQVRPAPDETLAVLLRQLAAEGHRRIYRDGDLIEIDSADIAERLDDDRVWLVLDRLRVSAGDPRLAQAVETAFSMGERMLQVVFWDRSADDGAKHQRVFYSGYRCDACGAMHATPSVLLFNPQSGLGRCSVCDGYGRTVDLDIALLVPDPARSLEEGAFVCFETPTTRRHKGRMLAACREAGIPIDLAWTDLPQRDRSRIMNGVGAWEGVRGYFRVLGEDRHNAHVRIYIARYRGYTTCGTCEGTGLSDDARAVRIGGASLADLLAMRIEELRAWTDELRLGGGWDEALEPLLREMRERLAFLDEAGTGYLTLLRAARTLSGGEMHRVVLATSVGRMLTDTCYVLDEPTAGLHPADTERLFRVVERLRDTGNTVVVVEHDPDVIRGADHVIEMGPDAGEGGGLVCFEGSVAELIRRQETTTGRLLAERSAVVPVRRPPAQTHLVVRNATLHNLHRLNVAFGHGRFHVVTGVSGSGKSTLVSDVLHGLLLANRGQQAPHLAPATLEGDIFGEVVLVDQGSMPRSSRSCPLTVSGAYTAIRDLFAKQTRAIELGLTAGTFSFNTGGGRCAQCEGTGVINVEMHFLADIELPCEACDGKRFTRSTLEVRVEGRTIHDVFEMTVSEAMEFFERWPTIPRRLAPLVTVGLGYLRMGQTTSRMSGGELQRLKLAGYMGGSRSSTDAPTLFLFDEPTVGLHMRDVDVLVSAMQRLVDDGHTVIVVEHNLDLIRAADHVIDLGPGGGPRGGKLVYSGSPDGLVEAEASVTGRFLRASFA